MPIQPYSERQKTLIANNIVKACDDINALNSTGYKYLYLCSGFIAHYNLNGFKAYYRAHSLKRDIELNYRQNQWKNFIVGVDRDAEYYHSKRDVYNMILGKLVAKDELDAIQFMRDHFIVVNIGV